MEEVVQWAANVMDHETGNEKTTQAEERVRRISSELHCEILDLSGGENITELCKRKKKIKKTYTPRVSAEIPVIGAMDPAEFMNAASQGKLNVIDKYLADGGNPNVHDELKRTALHRASLEGHTAVVQILLEKGADINFKDQLGSRAIHWACRGGSLGVVKALKSHGADLNVRDKLYSTPLHVATRTGHSAIVEYLLSCGAKISSRDREGDTALHDAVRLNRYKIVKLLIVAGADTKIKNHEGVTAVQQVKQWQLDIMETLQRLEKMREVGPDSTLREE
ncbi:ankyrin repeat domain-containing protein 2 [Plectropomus leopardus]|uniref:ankyrin repeat domain-containing protein 2 n=1 Tax=Plectropomus leopardus TaxID=160734 RepID=UPI001C4C1E91|nr:ankyrin repeat domain-containing protein 2 [Plectropomus leopardus]